MTPSITTAPGRPFGQQTHPTTPGLGRGLGAGGEDPRKRVGVAGRLCRRGGGGLPVGAMPSSRITTWMASTPPAPWACSAPRRRAATSSRLDREHTGWALGIAGGLSSGLRANRGTMAKALNAGRAAENGVVAATLAAKGFTASASVFEDPMGFFSAACDNRYDRELLRFGSPYFLSKAGHRRQALSLRSRHASSARCAAGAARAPPGEPPAPSIVCVSTCIPTPHGRWFTIAPSAASRASSACPIRPRPLCSTAGSRLEHSTDTRVRDSRIRALMPRVELVRDPELNPLGGQGAPAKVELVLMDGLRYYEAASAGRAKRPDRPGAGGEISGNAPSTRGSGRGEAYGSSWTRCGPWRASIPWRRGCASCAPDPVSRVTSTFVHRTPMNGRT